MIQKSRIQIKAKEINSIQISKTYFLLFFCVVVTLLLSNLKTVFIFAPTYFDFTSFLTNKYVQLIISFFVLLVTIPILAKLKAIREIWFIFKAKTKGEIKYKPVKNTVKQIGIKRYTTLYLLLWILNIFWAILLLLPSAILFKLLLDAISQSAVTNTIAIIIIIGDAIIFTIGFLTFLCVHQRYALSYWILLQRNDLNIRKIISESTKLMDKYCVDMFLFKLRFIAWIILSILFLPSAIYVFPYYKQSCAVYSYLLLACIHNKREDKTITFEKIKEK